MSRHEVICIEERIYAVIEKDINSERSVLYGYNEDIGEIVVKVLGKGTF
jgi:hypothetical protein